MVVARTLAPGSRGEKKAHTVLDFFFLHLGTTLDGYALSSNLFGKEELAMRCGALNAGACRCAAIIYRAITVH